LTTVRILNWIARIAGVGALLLGLTIWITGINIAPIHMLFGITLTLSFLILSIILVFTRGMRLLGAAGIIYALIVPVFGVTQDTLLTGDLHWLIRVAHMLVGLGALTLIQVIYIRYERLKQSVAEQKTASQVER
jgi:hypothetical protein